jgi:Na+/melibiose symporter-like transporter
VVVMIASVPAFARFAGRRSKRVAYGRAMLGAAVLLPLFTFVGHVPGLPDGAELLTLMALAGVPLAGVFLFPAALTADIVDDDVGRTGFRREGMYYGA